MPTKLLLWATGDQEVSNTITETTIFSGTVPGGILGTDNVLIIRMIGDFLQNVGTNQTFTLRLKYGGVTVFTFTSISLVSDLDRHADSVLSFITASGSASAQRAMMSHAQGGANSATGRTAVGNDHNNSVNQLTVNSSINQTLEITVQLSTASTNFSYRRRGVWVEVGNELPGTGFDLLLWDTTEFSYNNDNTERVVYQTMLPGGILGNQNLLIMRVCADVLCNVVGGSTGPRIYLGGTKIFDFTSNVTMTQNVSRRAEPLELWIGSAGSPTSQRILVFNQVDGIPGTDVGVLPGTGANTRQSSNAASIDLSIPQPLVMTMRLNVADPAFDYRKRSVMIGLLKPQP